MSWMTLPGPQLGEGFDAGPLVSSIASGASSVAAAMAAGQAQVKAAKIGLQTAKVAGQAQIDAIRASQQQQSSGGIPVWGLVAGAAALGLVLLGVLRK